MSDRIETLLAQMTLEEKASLLAGADTWHTVPLSHLDIPAIKVTDGPNGVRGGDSNTGATSACFPVGVAMGATWNVDLIRQVGEALAEEVKAKGAHVLLAPTVNIHRSPVAGRNFECFAEDPYLSGMVASAYINGLQSQGVSACIKHFVCNDSEFERFSMSSEVVERPLHEIYLEPFRIALQQANPWSLMSAYNRVNGIYASEQPYTLGDILKKKWAYDGVVISDWYGTYSENVPGQGLDLEMPGPARWMDVGKIVAAVEVGSLDETVIDDKARRLLRLMERTEAFERPVTPEEAIDKPEHRQLARQAAAEAIVLLKNEASVLPLDPQKVKKIAVIGENAQWAQIMGGGSSAVNPHYVVSPLEGIRNRAGNEIAVDYEIGCFTHKMPPLMDMAWITAENGDQGFTLHYYDNLTLAGDPIHTMTVNKAQMSWFGTVAPYVNPKNFSMRLQGTLTVPTDGIYELHLMCIGKGQLIVDGEEIINNWGDAPTYGEGITKLELMAKRPYSILVEYSTDPGSQWTTVRLGCLLHSANDSIQAAVDLAVQADVAVIIAGLTNEWESEGFDRADMELVGQQNELITRVAAVNPQTIVVLNVGSPVAMPWIDQVSAVLQLWYAGQETGNALSDILFGDVSPSGKLPTTFPKRLEDNPAFINYPGENGKVYYGEGIFVGYRYYEKKGVIPLFPFGHGLSYTQFAYSNMNIANDGQTIVVSLDVTNSGDRVGQEVVQLYVRDVQSRLVRPLKELKTFAKVLLQPGQHQTVTLTLNQQSLAFYDTAVHNWVTEPGVFELLVGSSSQDIRLTGQFEWQGNTNSVLHIGMKLEELLADPHGKSVLEAQLPGMTNHPMINMALGMSLETIARFASDVLTPEKLQAIAEALAVR